MLVLAPLPALLVAGAFDGGPTSRRIALLRWTHVATLVVLSLCTLEWVTSRGGLSGDYGVDFATRRAQAEAVMARVDGPPGVPGQSATSTSGFSCHGVEDEVEWIVRWLAADAAAALAPRLHGVQVCDHWASHDGVATYEWLVTSAAAHH